MNSSISIDAGFFRKLALKSQGLLNEKAFGTGLSATQKAISHLGYVQIDTISVVERAHHHVLFSRVPDYHPSMIDELFKQKKVFEYWSHAAAFLPIEDYRFSLPFKNAIRSGQKHWYKNPDRKLMKELLEKIQIEGPLRSKDLESKKTKQGGWWNWKPAKKALEQLYMEGALMVKRREGFQKVYDLTERVLPDGIDNSEPTPLEFAEHLIEQQLKCHGLVSLKGITYLRKNQELKKAVKELTSSQLAQGSLQEVALENGETFFIRPESLEKPVPQATEKLQILSPFDNVVIQRDRLKAIFGFDYQIECYLPEAKRKYGYFSLPILYRDEFIGRMDCKAHRKEKRLEVKALHIEKENFDQDSFAFSFAEEFARFLRFQACESAELTNVVLIKKMKRLKRKSLG